MQGKSEFTDDMILGVIGIIISAGMSIFFLTQFIPIYSLILADDYMTMKPRNWLKIIIIFVAPIFGAIQASIGLFNKRNTLLRRSVNIITASMGLITCQIIVSMNDMWGGFHFTSRYLVFSIVLAIGTAFALFSFLGCGVSLLLSENRESHPMKLISLPGVWMVGISIIFTLISCSCIASGIYQKKQHISSYSLTLAELNILAVLGILTFLGIFVTIYGIYLSRKKPITGVFVILLGSIWLQVYQNMYKLGFWGLSGYMYSLEYMYLIELFSVIQLVLIVVGVGSIISDSFQCHVNKIKPKSLYLYCAFDFLVILIMLIVIIG